MDQKTPYVILGCGYTGTRLAQALLREGFWVRACARRVALLEPLREQGADVHYLDASKPRQFISAIRGVPHPNPVVVYSIPGVPMLPAGEAVRRAADAAQQAHARAFIYLGTTGVYGRNELTSNEEWVDEDSAVDIHDPDMALRLSDEASVSMVKLSGLRTVVLRLSAIYGPPLWPGQAGRGVRQRLRKGTYTLWDEGRYYFSRIHVDDLVAVIRAAADRAPAGALYTVGDDHPCPQGEYGRWLAAHMGLPEPRSADSLAPEAPRQVIRGRRISNRRMKQELGINLLYPTYREGEGQIDAEEAEGAAPAPAPAAPQAAPAPPPRWPFVLGPGGDLGERIGLGALRAEARELAPGQRAEPGWVYLVLTGAPVAEREGRPVTLQPHDLVPPGTALHNPGPAAVLLLALRPPAA